MSAHRRGFKYQLSELEHQLITNAARKHNCRPRDLIVKAVVAYVPAALGELEVVATRNELAKIASVVLPNSSESLTRRESEVLALLAQGLSNKLIAARLYVSEHTAKFHVNQLSKKLGESTRTAIVVEAMQRGWLAIERADQAPTIIDLQPGVS